MLAAVSQAKGVLTDSGGLQKEAYMLAAPCITLRNETEWIETVQAGWNTLAGIEPINILRAVSQLKKPARHPPLFGDGQTSRHIADLLLQ